MVKNLRFFFFIISLMIVFTGCNRPEAPEFKGVRDVRINDGHNNQVVLTGYADFYNPNNYKIVLKKADIGVILNDREVTRFTEDYNLHIEKNASFTVPVRASLSRSEINNNLINSALSLLFGGKITLRYEGHIRVRAYGVGIRVPVRGESDIDPKNF